MAWKLIPGYFLILKESYVKKESEEVCVLIWKNFNSFANIYII